MPVGLTRRRRSSVKAASVRVGSIFMVWSDESGCVATKMCYVSVVLGMDIKRSHLLIFRSLFSPILDSGVAAVHY